MSTGVLPKERPRAAAPRVEPRLAARRMEVARDRGRRRLRWVLLFVFVLVLIAAGVAATRSPLLDVDRVVVEGGSETEADAARAAAGISVGSAMVSVSTGGAEARLEALPWVERATVTRAWPDTVKITLVERSPVAIVGSGSDAVLVDAAGRSLGPASGQALPVVGGDPVPAGESLGSGRTALVSMLADLPPDLRSEVAEARISDSGITLTLTDGIEVKWGDDTQATAKADALAVLLEQADRPTIEGIDVSVPRAATLTRND